MRRVLLAGTLLLSGCASYSAHEARTRLLGINQNELIGCAGPPESTLRLDRHDAVMAWDFKSDTAVFSLDVLTLGTMSLGPRGECRAVFRLHDGVVRHVAYEATTSSFAGPLGACGPIVNECLHHRETMPLEAGDDPMALAPAVK